MHLGDCYEGKRVIFAVDAADVSPRVIIHKNGQIDGFLNEDALVPGEQASALRASLQHLRDFVSEHQKDIVKDCFVVFVCPWKGYMEVFQFCYIRKEMAWPYSSDYSTFRMAYRMG